uniref:Uncharacterized protein n=1 Tax=Parascaris univalens TaxID=6257 RepID=A0A915A4D9_PARUN
TGQMQIVNIIHLRNRSETATNPEVRIQLA